MSKAPPTTNKAAVHGVVGPPVWGSVAGCASGVAVAWATGAVAMGLLAWVVDRPGQEIMYRVVPVIGGIVPGALLATGLVRLIPPDRKEWSVAALSPHA
ncbi:MAG: hypothetical protein ACK2U9_13655, partial [Anaerolineae bacterium]